MEKKSFIARVVEYIKGENSEAIAKKIQKRAKSVIEAQIALLKAKQVESSDKLDNFEESKDLAIMNQGKVLEDGDSYLANLVSAQDRINEEKARLEEIEGSIKFFNDILNTINDK